MNHYTDFLRIIAGEDADKVKKANEEYGDSWCKRGGAAAFLTIWRKVDRIEEQAGRKLNNADKWDIFEHVRQDNREEGLIDDIRDLRRYLLLLEAYLRFHGYLVEKGEYDPLERVNIPLPSGEVIYIHGDPKMSDEDRKKLGTLIHEAIGTIQERKVTSEQKAS